MIRYLASLVCYIAFYVIAMLLAPVLPAFARRRFGLTMNNNAAAVEPRLPAWLSWFDTPDNSLWGDAGWRTKHCPDHWDSYLGMVLWLWRNPACGYAWSIVSYWVEPGEAFSVKDSGNGLNVDKGKGLYGWYLITSSGGAFSLRWCKLFAGKVFSLEAGWLLDIYVKDPSAKVAQPRAPFQFQPQIKTPFTAKLS